MNEQQKKLLGILAELEVTDKELEVFRRYGRPRSVKSAALRESVTAFPKIFVVEKDKVVYDNKNLSGVNQWLTTDGLRSGPDSSPGYPRSLTDEDGALELAVKIFKNEVLEGKTLAIVPGCLGLFCVDVDGLSGQDLFDACLWIKESLLKATGGAACYGRRTNNGMHLFYKIDEIPPNGRFQGKVLSSGYNGAVYGDYRGSNGYVKIHTPGAVTPEDRWAATLQAIEQITEAADSGDVIGFDQWLGFVGDYFNQAHANRVKVKVDGRDKAPKYVEKVLLSIEDNVDGTKEIGRHQTALSLIMKLTYDFQTKKLEEGLADVKAWFIAQFGPNDPQSRRSQLEAEFAKMVDWAESQKKKAREDKVEAEKRFAEASEEGDGSYEIGLSWKTLNLTPEGDARRFFDMLAGNIMIVENELDAANNRYRESVYLPRKNDTWKEAGYLDNDAKDATNISEEIGRSAERFLVDVKEAFRRGILPRNSPQDGKEYGKAVAYLEKLRIEAAPKRKLLHVAPRISRRYSQDEIIRCNYIEIDGNMNYIAAENGVWNILTGELVVGKEARDAKVTQWIPDLHLPDKIDGDFFFQDGDWHEYKTERISKLFRENESEEISRFIIDTLGFAMFGRKQQFAPFFITGTNSGKTAMMCGINLFKPFAKAMGENALAPSPRTDPSGHSDHKLVFAAPTRIVYAEEVDRKSVDGRKLKEITGGSAEFRARGLNQSSRQFKDTGLPVLYGNDPPLLYLRRDGALIERLVFIPISTIPKAARDVGIKEILSKGTEGKSPIQTDIGRDFVFRILAAAKRFEDKRKEDGVDYIVRPFPVEGGEVATFTRTLINEIKGKAGVFFDERLAPATPEIAEFLGRKAYKLKRQEIVNEFLREFPDIAEPEEDQYGNMKWLAGEDQDGVTPKNFNSEIENRFNGIHEIKFHSGKPQMLSGLYLLTKGEAEDLQRELAERRLASSSDDDDVPF